MCLLQFVIIFLMLLTSKSLISIEIVVISKLFTIFTFDDVWVLFGYHLNYLLDPLGLFLATFCGPYGASWGVLKVSFGDSRWVLKRHGAQDTPKSPQGPPRTPQDLPKRPPGPSRSLT